MKKQLKAALFGLMALALAGCGDANGSSKGGEQEQFAPVELLSCGSTSVDKVITELGIKFASLTGNKVTLKKDQRGSGDATTGVTAGKNNTKYDIGFLSREIKDSEASALGEGNKRGAMCKDAVVPIVNAENGYAETSASALQKIYKGETANWGELVSGQSGNIKLYSREAGSGTRECFFEGIGYGEVKAEDKWADGLMVSSQSSNGDMMAAIRDDKNGIGYCSLDSLAGANGIKGLKFEGVAASEATVNDGTYRLSRNFNYVIRDDYGQEEENRKTAVNAFIDFFGTKEGLIAIKSKGGIVAGLDAAPSWATIQKERYPELTAK